jgi:hypothetical protein
MITMLLQRIPDCLGKLCRFPVANRSLLGHPVGSSPGFHRCNRPIACRASCASGAPDIWRKSATCYPGPKIQKPLWFISSSAFHQPSYIKVDFWNNFTIKKGDFIGYDGFVISSRNASKETNTDHQ